MKTFSVFARTANRARIIRRLAEAVEFQYKEENPDFIITFGGDGTYLFSEYLHPGTPKLIVQDSLTCSKCCNDSLPDALEKMSLGETEVVEVMKLEVEIDQRRITAVNDITVRNQDPRHALRFTLSVNGDSSEDVLIGDGVVVATPFGSTGYYASVTGESFKTGMGVGFNNLTKRRKPILLERGGHLDVQVVRRDAHVCGDNRPDLCELHEGERMQICASDQVARLITRESLKTEEGVS